MALELSLIALASSPISLFLSYVSTLDSAAVAVDHGITARALPAIFLLLFIGGGIIAGFVLWAVERLGAASLRLPAPPCLYLVHPVGIAITAGLGSLFTSALTQLLATGQSPSPVWSASSASS